MGIRVTTIALILAGFAAAYAQTNAPSRLEKAHRLWDQRLANSAIAAFEKATKNPADAAEAWEALGRIYMFKGWQQEGAFPGWHDETDARAKAVDALKRAVAADPKRTSAAEALKQALAFASSSTVVPPAPPRPEVVALDAKIEAWAKSKAPVSELEALMAARAKLQADPAPFFTVAHMLIDRKEYARAQAYANDGRLASARFTHENESAYLMTGKYRNFAARNRAAGLVISGTIALARMDFTQAETLLEQADRMTHGDDVAAQVRLGDLAMARKDLDRAETHYVNALSLTGGPGPLRTHATEALMNIRASLEDSAGFDAWLEETVKRRREERRAQALKSVLNRPLPPVALTSLDGKRIDPASFRGKTLLLNFFSSWCGACRQEVPQLKKVYERYKSDPSVAFLLVSLDSDQKRLQRFLAEQQLPMPLARASQSAAQEVMGFDDVPATFYVDREGVVRYETRGVESHGDSAARVTWYLEALKTTK